MNLASWMLKFHWRGIAWFDYSEHCWRLFPLSHKGSGSCSWATADLSLAGWQLRLLSCWLWAAAGPVGGSEDSCDAARDAWCPLASRKSVGSWRTWPPSAHVEQRFSFCTGTQCLEAGLGIWFPTWCSISVSFGRRQRWGACFPKWQSITASPGWQSRVDSHWLWERGRWGKKTFSVWVPLEVLNL